ncbi:hypothetical protein QEH56_13720 [Pelagicoccus enzymogenes]|uniref:hypothetical protein n=1 Tax=Pelagicoccus enzymogenes TaxID=2773457 RepID=UPI00280F609B|nr:hypothetical protein [Pelagicoccus enzymogenes]MDQ8199222.1 hypothetical protein [Pelagicoccus enzymogenes]
MNFEYKYHGSSSVSNSGSKTGLSFAPDTHREPTFFVGTLDKSLPFREAISTLHDVVVSDLNWKPEDKEEYKRWAKSQEDIWIAQALAEGKESEKKIDAIQARINAMNTERTAILSPFYKAQRRYFDYLYKVNRDWWFVLDPVITVHPDQLFFECFSQDESSYGKLSIGYDVFKNIDSFACGTTNIDYSDALYQEFQKIRSYKETDFKIDPSGFEISTEKEEDFKEMKIDLPDSWVRGFLQVSSAMTLPATQFDLHPMDMHNICALLIRNKEKVGPRSLRFILKPGEPIRVSVDPWNYVIKCPRSIFKGEHEDEIRIWGRRRLLILQRLLPITKRFRVTLLGKGMPSFYEADMGNMTFTLGLSGWTANDWSKLGNFDLMAPRAEIDPSAVQLVYDSLRETWFEEADTLARRVNLDRETVLGALSILTQAGRVILDLTTGTYRVRELAKDPLPLSTLRFSNEREERAHQLVATGKTTVTVTEREGKRHMSGQTVFDNRKHKPQLVIDSDERIISGTCTCNFAQQNGLRKGPCEHMIAIRIADQRKQ